MTRPSPTMFQTNVFEDYETLSRRAADWLSERLRKRPVALVCFASGATPLRTYEQLTARGTKEPSLFASCNLLKLDEWGGLAMNDPATCEHQLRTAIVTPLGLTAQYTAFDSQPQDPEAECARIADWLEQNGPIDICVLGLGVNGHIGFNEPAESLEPICTWPSCRTRRSATPCYARVRQRPTYGLTLGVADILRSREVLILVSGRAKLEALRRLLTIKITTAFPASLLHLHPRATLFCDVAAYPRCRGTHHVLMPVDNTAALTRRTGQFNDNRLVAIFVNVGCDSALVEECVLQRNEQFAERLLTRRFCRAWFLRFITGDVHFMGADDGAIVWPIGGEHESAVALNFALGGLPTRRLERDAAKFERLAVVQDFARDRHH